MSTLFQPPRSLPPDEPNINLHGSDGPERLIVENGTARRTALGVLLCPSDGEPNHRNSYRFNVGRWPTGRSIQGPDGPFDFGFRPRVAAITDGLSRTAFVSERLGGGFRPGAPDPARDMKLPIDPFSGSRVYLGDEIFIDHCLDAPAEGWVFDGGEVLVLLGVGLLGLQPQWGA